MMTFVWLTGSAVIGVVAGLLAGRLMRGNGFGLVGDVIAGVLGAIAGGSLFRVAGLDFAAGLPGRLIASFVGAATVLFLVHVFTNHSKGQRSWS